MVETNIGRADNNDLVILDLQVSRTHAKIKEINQRFLLIDMGSSGGTYVNRTQVDQKILQPEDTILLGGSYKMIFMQERSKLPPDTKVYAGTQSEEESSQLTTTLNIPIPKILEDDDK